MQAMIILLVSLVILIVITSIGLNNRRYVVSSGICFSIGISVVSCLVIPRLMPTLFGVSRAMIFLP